MPKRLKSHNEFTYHKEKTANFEEAKTTCKGESGNLAKVQDLDTWNQLTTYEETDEEYGYWWLGARKNLETNEYRWLDGELFQQFSELLPITGDTEGKRCLALYNHNLHGKMKLFSMPCSQHMYFICKRSTGYTSLSSTSSNNEVDIATTTIGSTRLNVEMNFSNTISQQSTQAELEVQEDFFSFTTNQQSSDPGMWMFAALILALLLIVATIVLIILWFHIKKLKNIQTSITPAKNPADCKQDEESPSQDAVRTDPVMMSMLQDEEDI